LRIEGRGWRIAKTGPWWKLAAGEKGINRKGRRPFTEGNEEEGEEKV